MDVSKSVSANFTLKPVLSVSTTGAGSVSSNAAGIDCGSDCTEAYTPGTAVNVTATAASGNVFDSWTGACAGLGNPCAVTMDAAKSVGATFKPAPAASGGGGGILNPIWLLMLAIYRMRRRLALAAASLLSAGCIAAAQGTQSATDLLMVKHLPVAIGTGMHKPTRMVIRDGKAWVAVWEQIWPNSNDNPALPDIDFSRDIVLIASLSLRPSSGFGITLVPAASENGIHCEVKVLQPGPTCTVATVLTYPTDIVVIAAAGRRVEFTEDVATRNCR